MISCFCSYTLKHVAFHCRCWIWSSPMWPYESRSMCPMSSTPLWEQEDGSTLTYSRSWGSLLCTTLPSYGGTVSVAHQRLSYKVRPEQWFCDIKLKTTSECVMLTKCGIVNELRSQIKAACDCLCRCHVPNQHAYKWPGTTSGQLPHWGSIQRPVCVCSCRYRLSYRRDAHVVFNILNMIVCKMLLYNNS